MEGPKWRTASLKCCNKQHPYEDRLGGCRVAHEKLKRRARCRHGMAGRHVVPLIDAWMPERLEPLIFDRGLLNRGREKRRRQSIHVKSVGIKQSHSSSLLQSRPFNSMRNGLHIIVYCILYIHLCISWTEQAGSSSHRRRIEILHSPMWARKLCGVDLQEDDVQDHW